MIRSFRRLHRRPLLGSLAALPLGACAPTLTPAGPAVRAPALDSDAFVAADGMRLPVRSWPARNDKPTALVLGAHGFGDYSAAFEQPAAIWGEAGYETWSWDQRGFGASPTRGQWAGVETMVEDLCTMARLVQARRPALPLVAVGESMGAAVALTALGAWPERSRTIVSAVLSAPAARTRHSVGPVGSAALDLFAHTVPWLPVGPTSIDFGATDNRALMERLRKDRLILSNPRVDMVYGLTDLMDAAHAAAPNVRRPLLVLYGLGDRVVPPRPTRELVERLPDKPRPRLALYRKGYHMLFRDLQGDVVARDVASWIGDRAAPLPSGAERTEQAFLRET